MALRRYRHATPISDKQRSFHDSMRKHVTPVGHGHFSHDSTRRLPMPAAFLGISRALLQRRGRRRAYLRHTFQSRAIATLIF